MCRPEGPSRSVPPPTPGGVAWGVRKGVSRANGLGDRDEGPWTRVDQKGSRQWTVHRLASVLFPLVFRFVGRLRNDNYDWSGPAVHVFRTGGCPVLPLWCRLGFLVTTDGMGISGRVGEGLLLGIGEG